MSELITGLSATTPLVGVIMGSRSDFPVMSAACTVLKEFGIPFETSVVSAHRTPERMVTYAKDAYARGLRVIIAGAGGAAHLPGMVASLTALPVIGVPVKAAQSLDGWDSVLSILQMPGGVPVATVALNNAKNAGLLAIQILGSHNPDIYTQLLDYKAEMRSKIESDDRPLTEIPPSR
jgi:5-(carboxyamino)imidazole ribonucleotide mutase